MSTGAAGGGGAAGAAGSALWAGAGVSAGLALAGAAAQRERERETKISRLYNIKKKITLGEKKKPSPWAGKFMIEGRVFQVESEQ